MSASRATSARVVFPGLYRPMRRSAARRLSLRRVDWLMALMVRNREQSSHIFTALPRASPWSLASASNPERAELLTPGEHSLGRAQPLRAAVEVPRDQTLLGGLPHLAVVPGSSASIAE